MEISSRRAAICRKKRTIMNHVEVDCLGNIPYNYPMVTQMTAITQMIAGFFRTDHDPPAASQLAWVVALD